MWSLDSLNGNFAANPVEIREVWDHNLEEEISLIRSIVVDHPFISLGTKFPGVVVLPITTSPTSSSEFNYQTLQLNVNILKLIQLGLTFFDYAGKLPHFGSPPCPCIWQFNFREFNTSKDIFDHNLIDLFRRSGMNLEKNQFLGINADRFSKLMISSGVVRNDSVQWITFNSCYDLGYFLKMLTCSNLSDSRENFFRSLRQYFPKVYDIKYLMRYCSRRSSKGGLDKVAKDLEVNRAGTNHQTGSDSLLVAAIFMKLKVRFHYGSIAAYAGYLFDLSLD